jgi:hypothetical protein
MTTPPEHDSNVSPGFAETAWIDAKGSCSICGRAAKRVVLVRMEGITEICECRCQKHLPATSTSPTPMKPNPLFQRDSN